MFSLYSVWTFFISNYAIVSCPPTIHHFKVWPHLDFPLDFGRLLLHHPKAFSSQHWTNPVPSASQHQSFKKLILSKGNANSSIYYRSDDPYDNSLNKTKQVDLLCVALISECCWKLTQAKPCGIKPYSHTRKNNILSVLAKAVFTKYCVKCSNRQTELAIALYLLRSHMLHFINASKT